MSMFIHSCHLLLDYVLFTLIDGLTIPGSCAMLFFTALDCAFTTDTSTVGHHFRFGPASSFFLELLANVSHSPSVAYWTAASLRGLSSSVTSFCLFTLFTGFLRQEHWSGLPFPSPVQHVLSELSAMTHPSLLALQGMTHSFLELHKSLCHTRLWPMKGMEMALNPKTAGIFKKYKWDFC